MKDSTSFGHRGFCALVFSVALLFVAPAQAREWVKLDEPFTAEANWGCAIEQEAIDAYTIEKAFPATCRGGAGQLVLVVSYAKGERFAFFDGSQIGLMIAIISQNGQPLFTMTPADDFFEFLSLRKGGLKTGLTGGDNGFTRGN